MTDVSFTVATKESFCGLWQPYDIFFFFPSFGLEQTSKTPHYETTLVPAISEAPATHVVPPTSVQDQATKVSSVTPIMHETRVDVDDDDDDDDDDTSTESVKTVLAVYNLLVGTQK